MNGQPTPTARTDTPATDKPATPWIPLEELLAQPRAEQIRTRFKTEGPARYERMAAASGAFDVAAAKVLAEQEEWDRLNTCDRFE